MRPIATEAQQWHGLSIHMAYYYWAMVEQPGGQRTGSALLFQFLYFLTISVSPIISTSSGLIFTRFSPFGSAMAVDGRSEPRFWNC